ncbi:type II secretion system protein GspL [Xenophilus arseniciresistens]|uniref:Type II secretion system protein GspL n=1 Tax=Xenophilus arseniciresistens TaxID=1283306 RepID=A0AAE3N932_9BURK|nr:type II secretion system protein GspL [Xenophilus arseniciresistens]MDA7416784.1 type II secretion system protein GspL [Xenophilus arseniciresistens]
MSLILVQPPPPASPPGEEHLWARCDAARTQVTGQGRAAPALLPGPGELTLVIPAAALSWHTVTLPRGTLNAGARLRSVLAGLLEERLLDDPEQLHFALEPRAREGEPVWVATCDQAWLREAIQTLEAAGRRVGRLLPELTPRASDAPPAFYVTGLPEDARITCCDASGVVTLPLAEHGLALLQPPLPEGATLSAEPAVAQATEQLLGTAVPLQTTGERWLQSLASDWDLAQFALARTGRARAGKTLAGWGHTLWRAPRWRAARWGAAALVVAQLIGVNAWAWKERQALQAKRDAITQTLRTTFPKVQLVIDAPLQMRREVQALQQATGGLTPADLEPMLSALSASLPAGRVPTAIDYSGGQLRLRGLGLSVSELSALASPLAARGYNARGEGDLLLVQATETRAP